MTCSDDLAKLIDRAMSSGEFYGITIFADRDGTGPRVNLLHDISTATCDQVTDPLVPASERLRLILTGEQPKPRQPPLLELINRPKPEQFDDILG